MPQRDPNYVPRKNAFINIRTSYMPGVNMLVHISNIRLTNIRYTVVPEYEVYLPNPSIANKELCLKIDGSTFSKLYAILCNDLTWSSHQELYIEGEKA